MITGMRAGNLEPRLCAILATAARQPSETGAKNNGCKKIVRHEALRRPPKGRCDTQAFRIIQPGKERCPEVDTPYG